MLAVIPVTTENVSALAGLKVLYEKLGPNAGHRLLVFSEDSVLGEAQDFAQSLSRLFSEVSVVPFSIPVKVTSSTDRRNHLFRGLVEYLDDIKNKDPFIWVEHACPQKPGWLDVIQKEWDSKPTDRHFLGCIEETYFRAKKNGKVIMEPKPLFQHKGRHMRFGVYPPDMKRRCPLLRTAALQSFETYIQNEVVPFCHPAKSILSLWVSQDFERIGNSIKGHPAPDRAEIRKNASDTFSDHHYALVHGCKDFSLEFIISRRNHKAETEESVISQVRKEKSKKTRMLEVENRRLAAELAELKAGATKPTAKSPTKKTAKARA